MVTRVSKTRKNHFSFSRKVATGLTVLTLLGIMGVLLSANARIADKRKELLQKQETVQEHILRIEQQRQELEQGVLDSQNQEYQEKILRERGLYKKPGEEVVTILRPEEQKNTSEQNTKQQSWWSPIEMYHRLFGK
ncbi:MAG: hypothetical protein HYW95_03415 [Candidatus Wildermuthbacteria bacterium]|nr:hypothetical protein [Candidatus Wildermuthbacteria bacterium]